MDKQVIAVLLSFVLYLLYVMLPVIPTILIYKIFPDTKVSASGMMAKVSFKTTGAFAAYVVTVILGFFLVQNTHYQISQIGSPTWTIKGEVELLDKDGHHYENLNLLETLVVTIDPELQTINGNMISLRLPGDKSSWERTFLRFEIPKYGYKIVDLGNISKKAEINPYDLVMTLDHPIRIKLDEHMTMRYDVNGSETLQPDNSVGPGIGGNFGG